MAENLELRRQEIAERLSRLTGAAFVFIDLCQLLFWCYGVGARLAISFRKRTLEKKT